MEMRTAAVCFYSSVPDCRVLLLLQFPLIILSIFGFALYSVIPVLCNLRRITSLFDVKESGLGLY